MKTIPNLVFLGIIILALVRFIQAGGPLGLAIGGLPMLAAYLLGKKVG